MQFVDRVMDNETIISGHNIYFFNNAYVFTIYYTNEIIY
jgi:hypothetical protein